MNIAILKTGIFPDTETVDDAVEHLLSIYNVYVYDASREGLSKEDWDQALDEILSSERFIVV